MLLLRILMYCSFLMALFTMIKLPGPLVEKHPKSIRFQPPCLTVGMVFLGLKATPFLHQMKDTSLWPNNSIFVSSDHKTEEQKSSSLLRWASAKAKWAFVCLILKSGVLLGLRPWIPSVCSVCWNVCLERLPPVEPRLNRMALVVILGFFFTYLTIPLASTFVTFVFHLRPLRFSMVQNALYYLLILYIYYLLILLPY